MQVTQGLLENLCSEPSSQPRGLQIKDQRRSSPAIHGAELGPQAARAYMKAVPACLPFVSFSTKICHGGANSKLLCRSEQEMPVNSWASRELGGAGWRFHHTISPKIQNLIKVLPRQQRSSILPWPQRSHHSSCVPHWHKPLTDFLTPNQYWGL